VAHVLLSREWSIKILARNLQQALTAVDWLSGANDAARMEAGNLTDEALVSEAGRAELLVNATPVGAAPHSDLCPWPVQSVIPDTLIVIDVVAWPTQTFLVQRARRDGATAMGGLPMLVGQAAAAFELFTGVQPPIDVMHRAAHTAASAAQSSSDKPTTTATHPGADRPTSAGLERYR
jgi:shikimate dehydrogenase